MGSPRPGVDTLGGSPHHAASSRRGDAVTAPWEYRDPLESTLAAGVSAPHLMEHVRTIGALERESGSPGEAQAFDYIERTLKSYGVEVERREIEAFISLPQEARLTLPDGSVHAGADALLLDLGRGAGGRGRRRRRRPSGGPASARAGKIALVRGLASPGGRGRLSRPGCWAHVHVLMDHLHNMIVTTVWGTPGPETAWRIPRHAVPVDPRRRRREAARPPGRGPPAAAHDDARAHGLDAHPPPGRRADRAPRGPLPPALRPRRLLALRRHGQRLGQRDHAGGRPAAARGGATRCDAASASRSGRGTRTAATRARPGTPTTPGASCTSAASSTSTSTRRAPGAPPTTPCSTPPRTRRRSPRASWPTSPASGPAAGASRGPATSRSGAPACPRRSCRSRGCRSRTPSCRGRWSGWSAAPGFPWWWHTKDDTVDKIDADVLVLDTKVYLASAPALAQRAGAAARPRPRRPEPGGRAGGAAGGGGRRAST